MQLDLKVGLCDRQRFAGQIFHPKRFTTTTHSVCHRRGRLQCYDFHRISPSFFELHGFSFDFAEFHCDLKSTAHLEWSCEDCEDGINEVVGSMLNGWNLESTLFWLRSMRCAIMKGDSNKLKRDLLKEIAALKTFVVTTLQR